MDWVYLTEAAKAEGADAIGGQPSDGPRQIKTRQRIKPAARLPESAVN